MENTPSVENTPKDVVMHDETPEANHDDDRQSDLAQKAGKDIPTSTMYVDLSHQGPHDDEEEPTEEELAQRWAMKGKGKADTGPVQPPPPITSSDPHHR